MKQSMRNHISNALVWCKTHVSMVIVFALVLALDRVSKVLAQMLLQEGPISVFPFFQFLYVKNTGAAFGIMQHQNGILIVGMLLIIAFILHNWKELSGQGKMIEWGSLLILAGALGNLYDRITLGYVVDFLDFKVWPVFNVSDSAITIGAVMYAITLFCNYLRKQEIK